MAVAVTSLLTASVVALGMFTGRSFLLTGNYVNLDAQSRNASDVLGREIRDASTLVSFSTNNPLQLKLANNTAGYTITITYYTNNSTLMFAKTGLATQMLLTNCDNWSFSLFDRVPLITSTNITFYSTTDPAQCKVIDMSWKCSRTILGSKMSTESVQTAEIVLRNKVN